MPPAGLSSGKRPPAAHSRGRAGRGPISGQAPGPRTRSKLSDTVFAVVHVLALVAVFLYGLVALIGRNPARFALVMGGLVLYYVLVLHAPVKKEIARRREGRPKP